VLLDLEMVGVGSGPQELAQMLISHMEPALRAACELQLLRAYHTELLSRGVQQLSWEACLAEYRAGGAARWIWFLPVLAAACPAPMTQFWINQLQAFLEDHNITAETVGMPRV
jgi:hypothetical protein